MGTLILVFGPTRSGKSEWAEQLARNSGLTVTYVATAAENRDDPEWTARLERHRQRRPASWQTVCAPRDLTAVINRHDQYEHCLLVDSLGSWVSNWLETDEAAWQAVTAPWLTRLQAPRGTLILVAEEVGAGVVPAYALGRRFRDRLGHLMRQVGALARPVYWVTGGHVLDLSQLGQPLPSAG